MTDNETRVAEIRAEIAERFEAIAEMYRQGVTVREIARRMGVSVGNVDNCLRLKGLK